MSATDPRAGAAINDSPDETAIATCGTCHPPEEDTPEREAMDRFATFLRIVGDAPRDDEGHYLVNPRALEYAKGGDVDPFGCTGVTARWCPRHGDCTCPHPEDEPGNGEAWHMASPGCPLHDPAGDHPWPDDAELPRDNGHAETTTEAGENGSDHIRLHDCGRFHRPSEPCPEGGSCASQDTGADR